MTNRTTIRESDNMSYLIITSTPIISDNQYSNTVDNTALRKKLIEAIIMVSITDRTDKWIDGIP